jgi:uncharacterized protein YggE
VADQPQLKVVGAGVATGTPDQCQLQIALTCMAGEAAAALSACAELAAQAIVAIEEVDGARCDVQTVGISVQDFFDQSDQRVTAKIGTYQLQVIVRPIDSAGGVLTALGAVAGDALAVRGFQLGVRDPEPLRSEARRRAVEDAKRRASELSEAADIRLGPIVALEDGGAAPGQTGWRAMAMSVGASSAVPIEPGEVSASSTVTITYAIAPSWRRRLR